MTLVGADVPRAAQFIPPDAYADVHAQHIHSIDETVYIVIERFDRLAPLHESAFVQRVHQENLCQALRLMPGISISKMADPGSVKRTTYRCRIYTCVANFDLLMSRLRQLADAVPDAVSAARGHALAEGLNRTVTPPSRIC